MSVFLGFPCTKESVREDEDGEFWLGCLLEEDARNLKAGLGSSWEMAPLLIPQQSEEQTQLFSDLVLLQAQLLMLLSRLLSHVYLVMVTQKGGKADHRDFLVVLSLKPGFPSVKDIQRYWGGLRKGRRKGKW